VEIRRADNADAARIAEIYEHYVIQTVITFDLEAPSVDNWERRLRAAEDAGYPVLVGCEDGRVIGFALLTAWKPRPAYRFTAEDSVYIDPAFTGAGRGRALLEHLLDRGRQVGIRQVIAAIADAGIESSVALHRANGFHSIGRMERVGFKHNRWVDVDLLQLDLQARRWERSVNPMTDAKDEADQFFERYTAALLARDAKAIAAMYAVPSLILFPGSSIAVSDANQTEAFFAASWSQYEGVDAIDKQVVIMGEAPSSIWADVTWSYGGRPQERFCYQLIEETDGYQIAVLTPMA
jgi:L-amino acid N-acyltransferase YncA